MTLFVPQNLKKAEQEIAQELAQSNIKINFKIVNYRQDNSDLQYRLTSTQMPLPNTERQAREIIDRYMKKWKEASL
ncbi:MAG: hypothetical protein NWF00_00735 [Candidatus Bathyarchaeota archaeon]|nr:hypothetical protein [Candidatus Bathyarchaeota archaeon]